MAKSSRKKPARPIKTKRDFEGASEVVKRMSGKTVQDSAAELRLQFLLKELDRFDVTEDEASTDSTVEYDTSGPRRRWSDDTPDAD